MKTLFHGLTAAAAILALGACDQLAANRAAAEKDRPVADEKAPTTTTENQAVINATPSVSMTAEEREQFRALAKSYLDDAGEQLAEGYSAVAGVEDTMAAMAPTQSHDWRISLTGGHVYKIIGSCDNECSDMDIELIDPSGKVVERDTLADDVPVVNISPRANGAYTARLIMKTCTIAPCYAAARLYERTGSASRPSTRT